MRGDEPAEIVASAGRQPGTSSEPPDCVGRRRTRVRALGGKPIRRRLTELVRSDGGLALCRIDIDYNSVEPHATDLAGRPTECRQTAVPCLG